MSRPSSFQDPWAVAKGRFLEGLDDKEKEQFKRVTVEDILYAASAAQKQAQANSRAWYMAAKLMPLVDAIGQYGQALDIISNTQSGILCPLWGGIRVVLTLAESFGKYHEKLMDMFERIGDVLPRFNTYAQLFASRAYLLHSLSLVYLDILQFCTAAKQVFLDSKQSKIGSSSKALFPSSSRTMSKLLWKPFEKQFGDIMDRFRRHKENVEREAMLSHMIESSEERKAQADERKLQKAERNLALQKQLEDEARRRGERWNLILSRLCRYNYEKKMRQSQSIRHKGTCEWIGGCAEYVAWSKSSKSTVLWVHGKAGCGKTIISGWVHESQLEKVKKLKSAVLLYYPCDFKEADSLSFATIIQSFIKQMALSLGQHRIPDSLLEALADAVDSGTLEFDEAVEIFFNFARNFECIWIILDGIDECDSHNRADIFRWIALAASFSDSMIAVYVSSRKDIEIKDELKRYPNIPLTTRQPVDDLNNYIAEEVESLRANGILKFSNPKFYATVVDKLIKKADGMFLWVSLQLRDLCDCATDAEVEETLEELPIGLYETYERALLRILVDHGTNTRRRVWPTSKKVYEWLYHAIRPLTLDELMEAIAIDFDDGNLDFAKVATEDERWKIIKRCGNLLEYNEADQTVTFFHYTLKQYITDLSISSDPEQDTPWDHKLVAMARDIRSSEVFVAETCLTYLSFSDFEASVIPFQQSALNSNMEHILQYTSNLAGSSLSDNAIGRGVQSILRGFKLMNGMFDAETRPCNIDFERYIYEAKPPPDSIIIRYKLLDYVQKFWLQHCRALGSLEPPFSLRIYPKFLKLCFEREFLFDVRPWGKRYSRGTYPYTDAFIWAVENDHCFLVSMIWDRITSEDRIYYTYLRLQEGRTPLSIAASHSTPALLDLLLLNAQDLMLSARLDSDRRNLLHIAALHGSPEVSKFLLAKVPLLHWMQRDIYENTPLDYALECGNPEAIHLLVQNIRVQDIRDIATALFSPGWSTDGTTSWKIEKMFLVSYATYPTKREIYSAFKLLFQQWIQNVSSRDNEYLLKGIKTALADHCLFLLVDTYIPAGEAIQLGPKMRGLLTQVLRLAIFLEDHHSITTLLREYEDISTYPQKRFREICKKRPVNYRELGFVTQFTLFPGAIPRLLALLCDIPKADEMELTIPKEGEFEGANIAWLASTFTDFKYSTFQTTLNSASTISAAETKFFWHNLTIALHIHNHRQDPSTMRDLCSMGVAMLSLRYLPEVSGKVSQDSSIFTEVLRMIDHNWRFLETGDLEDELDNMVVPIVIEQVSALLSLLHELLHSMGPEKTGGIFLKSIDPSSILNLLEGPKPKSTSGLIMIHWMVQLLLLAPIIHVQNHKLYNNAPIGASTFEDHPIFEVIYRSDQILSDYLMKANFRGKAKDSLFYPGNVITPMRSDTKAQLGGFTRPSDLSKHLIPWDYDLFESLCLWAPAYLEFLLMENTTELLYIPHHGTATTNSPQIDHDYQHIPLKRIQSALCFVCNFFSNASSGSPPRLSERQFLTICRSIQSLLVAGADPIFKRDTTSRGDYILSPFYIIKSAMGPISHRKEDQAKRILSLFENCARIHSEVNRVDLRFPPSMSFRLCTSKTVWARRMRIVETIDMAPGKH
ncbi:hypothetical protein TWF696_001112 [Orbilia brochopaga]|uniref:NACHT domain-containing protein n=1 Tax=Orbilia brochopaga TaxID=3140254 RepID=A0AAV9VGE6_9PEZI